MANFTKFKLGKNAPRHDTRALLLSNYLKPGALPALPPAMDWGTKVSKWPMMANDKIGDCTCAAAGHMIQEWTANAKKAVVLSDEQIVAAYSAITGYNPKTGKHDNGAVELDVLKYWRTIGFAGHKIEAYVSLEPGNHEHIKAGVFIFGGVYIGVALPISAQGQSVWSVPPGGLQGPGAAGSWGGHAVPVIAYDANGLTVITWGQRLQMTWGFWAAYCDEAYAILSPDFLNKNRVDPAGFNLTALRADLAALG